MLQVQLANSDNWQPLYDVAAAAVMATRPANKILQPIGEITIPVAVDKKIISCLAVSKTAKNTWHSAGFLKISVMTGIQLGGNYDVQATQQRKIWLGQNTLVFLPNYAATCALTFDVLPWFQNISLYFWQYVGPYGDSIDNKLDTIEQTINSINTLLNS